MYPRLALFPHFGECVRNTIHNSSCEPYYQCSLRMSRVAAATPRLANVLTCACLKVGKMTFFEEVSEIIDSVLLVIRYLFMVTCTLILTVAVEISCPKSTYTMLRLARSPRYIFTKIQKVSPHSTGKNLILMPTRYSIPTQSCTLFCSLQKELNSFETEVDFSTIKQKAEEELTPV